MERSNIYIDIKQYPKAIDDLSNALTRKPTDPKILYKRGLAYYKNKEFKLAKMKFEQKVDRNGRTLINYKSPKLDFQIDLSVNGEY